MFEQMPSAQQLHILEVVPVEVEHVKCDEDRARRWMLAASATQ